MSCSNVWEKWQETRLEYKIRNSNLQTTGNEKDLGVIIYKEVPIDHINEKARNMKTLLANMRVACTYIIQNMVRKIVLSSIRSSLENAAFVSNSHLKNIKKYKGHLQEGLAA